MKNLLSLVLLVVFLSGCDTLQSTYVPLKPGNFLPVRQAKDIAVITGTLNEPYEELGVILINNNRKPVF